MCAERRFNLNVEVEFSIRFLHIDLFNPVSYTHLQKVSNDTVPTELNPERQAAAEDTVQTQSAEGPVRVSIVVKGGSVLDKYSTNGLTANYAAANYRQQVRASRCV